MQEYIEFFRANPLLSLAWVGLFIGLLVSVYKSSVSKVTNVDHQQATLLINKQDAKVVDVRSKEEFKRAILLVQSTFLCLILKIIRCQPLKTIKPVPL